ncbi:unnamed protein product [Rhizoctonia solani]|uniref:Uncharacterized protein n=1 Tax=Rhizoctonia solani TaxID=456999 RepID=A0A8H3A8G3_9AGAM|nr:unnamed protein product [Rhizoctonia solani]
MAASTLSEAARAAAESLTLESAPDLEQNDSESNNLKDSASDLPSFPPLNLILMNPPPDPIVLATEPEPAHVEEDRIEMDLLEESAPEDQIVGIEDEEPLAGIELVEDLTVGVDVALLGPVERVKETSNIWDTHASDELPAEIGQANPSSGESALIMETEVLIDPKQPYRILVENELDVLLSACTLIGKNQRVICYMPCGTPPLSFYKQLIEGVTGIPVYFAERMNAAKRDAAYKHSLQNNGSVVLMPSTLSSEVILEGDNSWVIHIGWPPSREKYLSQVRGHQAKNNVIVAYSGDLEWYPSHAPLMDLTQDWPKYGASFIASVNALRHSFDSTLADIPDEVKEKVYADWIQSHGVYGPRYVKSWDSTMLVLQANHYLLYVLKYRCKDSDSDNTERILLPEVSPGFVAQNLLESAVHTGALLVKYHDSGLNHISSLARPEIKPATPAIMDSTEVNTSPAGTSTSGLPGQLSSGDRVRKQNTASRAETRSEKIDFKLTPGHTYFTIDEEFDAIPLMCYISEKYDKTVCFLEGQGSLRHYQKLFSKITQTTSVVIAPEATNSDQANNEAALRFVNSSIPAILLLTYSTTNLPTLLRENRVGCCIYWGFHLPLKQAKKHRDQLVCSSTTMIISKAQQSELKRQSGDIIEHPGARALVDLGPKSLLWPMRNNTVSVLMTEETTAKGLYVNRIYGLGTVSRAERSAEEVIRMANRYSAKVLLRGVLEDGSENFPPVAGRLPIPRTVVERFSLQPAVSVGLVSIG